MSTNPFQSAVELAQAYRRRECQPSEVVDFLLSRIDSLDGKLGAFQAVYADDARLAAEAADKSIRSGHQVGPFHGIPFALKDLIDVEDRITTGGSAEMAQRLSPVTATIAQRLLAAGGILIGKTKTTEVAMGGWGTNQYMGTPWNPWDLETHHTPGGSSSGSGVAVAAGLVPCAVGTDTGGSVRMPSAWCGGVGLKVSEGLLPTDGIIPCSHTQDTPGPMTRSTADTAFMFDVMAGVTVGELERHLNGQGISASVLGDGVRGLRLGSLGEKDREGVAEEILVLYDAALEKLKSLGAEIVPYEPPAPYEVMAAANGLIFTSEVYVHHGALMENPDARVDEEIRRKVLLGRDISARDYIASRLQREIHFVAFEESMRGFAAVLTPTMATAPIPLPEIDPSAIAGRFTRPVSYLAACALSVPMGLTPGQLPGGLQIIARRNDEITALRIGAAFEQAAGPIGPPPGVA